MTEEQLQYHVNGELVPESAATVSVRDRGFMYGDAAFETLRVYGGDPFAWSAHADRLQTTCETLGIDHGLTQQELRDRIDETLLANDLQEAYLKLSITRGSQPGTITPKPTTDPSVVIMVSSLPRGGSAGTDVWDEPATLATTTVGPVPDRALPANAKTHNYLPNVLARADIAPADEALVLTEDGTVLEGAASNCFFVRDGVVQTPAADQDLLPGITRNIVLDLAAAADIPTETGTYTADVVRTADEIFLTNSTWELRPVTEIDGRSLGVGSVTTELMDRYDRYVDARHY